MTWSIVTTYNWLNSQEEEEETQLVVNYTSRLHKKRENNPMVPPKAGVHLSMASTIGVQIGTKGTWCA